MKNRGFTLIELLIVIAIIAVLVGVATPYYENYVREAKLAKAKHELDIIKEALIKFDTFEDKKFTGTDSRILIGKYMQIVPVDPWGRDYLVDSNVGQVKSLGIDHLDPRDDIIVDYKPALALQKVFWVDVDNNRHVTPGDMLRFEFSRNLLGSQPITFAAYPDNTQDLQFSQEVRVADLVATSTISSSSIFFIALGGTADDGTFYPGSSTVRIASANVNIKDAATPPRKAAGSNGEWPGLDILIMPQ